MAWPFLAFLVSSTLLVALVLYVRHTNGWVDDRTDQVIAQTTTVERLVAERQARFRGFLLARAPTSWTAYIESNGRVQKAVDELQHLVSDNPAQVGRLAALQPVLDRWQRYTEDQIARLHDVRDPPSSHLVDGDAIQGELLSQLRGFAAVEKDLRKRRDAVADASTRWALALAVLSAVVGGPALAITTGRRMRRSRRRYHDALEAQVRTAGALQESEERLLLAENAANMGAWHWDLVTGDLVWSDRCKALFGLTPDTAMSHEAFLASLHPDDRGRVDAALKDALWKRRLCEVEMRVPSPGGSMRWIALKGEARYDAEGKPLRMAGMAMDVTDRRRAEDQVRSERDFSNAVLDTTASLIVVLDTEANIVRFSRACERLTGYAESEVRGRNVFELFIPGAEFRGVEATFRQLRSGDFPNQHRNRWRMKDGSERLIDWSNTAIADEHGRVKFIIATGMDITERTQAERALRETEERFRVLVMATSDVVYSMSPDWTEMRQLHSPRFLPETNEPFVGWMQKYIHPDDQAHVTAVIDDAIRKGSIFELEHRVIRADGSLGWTFSRAVPLKDAQGAITEWFGVATDRTPAKQAEEALSDANRRKDEFLGVLSHELRNPLAPIRTAIHILKRAPDGSEQAGRAKAVIERQTNQLSRLVDDLLDVTRISRGKIQLNRSRFELTELLRHVVEDHRPLFDSRAIALSLRIDVGPQWIDADSARIAQVIGNLLNNAAKFTNAHGHVVVTVARERSSQVRVHVTDDGIGMAPDMLHRVFEPFAQADESLHRSHGGLGLGLALVKALVEMHDGRVEASSGGPGKGAAFSVSLPIVPDAGVALETPVAAPPRPGRLRTLIIEDNLDAAETLKEVLEMEGHEVSVAHDGREGVARAHELGPDLVLCDIGLPGLDGYEVARQIRADRSISPTLVALTGYTRAEDQRKTFKAGFDHHFGKPVPIPELEKLLATVSAHRTARRILVLDDNDALRENLRELLEDEGWEVRVARDGEEAVEVVASGFAPAVLLLDYRLPGMDGGEVLQRLGVLHAAPQVVLMTASTQVREIALEHGLRFYVPKPFHSDELLDTVEHARSGS